MTSLSPATHQVLQLLQPQLVTFIERHYEGTLQMVQLRPLRGGLQAAGVFRVQAQLRGRTGRLHSGQFVVKCVPAEAGRELALYRALQANAAEALAPRLLGAEHIGMSVLLFLEWVRPVQRWPWRETQTASLVLGRLAQLHQWSWMSEPVAEIPWDYEHVLHQSSHATLEELRRVICDLRTAQWRGAVPMTQRLVEALPEMRRVLLAATPPIWIHGDMHPGNVVLCRGKSGLEPVLLDWARARLGSPLEDVSAWIQSLGHWEPQARRYHDTLVRRYLAIRGLEPLLDRTFRRLYWIAGTCNALAGALRYHLVTVQQARTPQARTTALGLIHKWLRLLRCADVHWRAG
jgi:Ser/Thr protein kinase RdoA (MazF antagonist)